MNDASTAGLTPGSHIAARLERLEMQVAVQCSRALHAQLSLAPTREPFDLLANLQAARDCSRHVLDFASRAGTGDSKAGVRAIPRVGGSGQAG
jgi:hypothetical protein